VTKILQTIRKSSLKSETHNLIEINHRGLMSAPGGEGERMWCPERTAAPMRRSSSPDS
jgi:hypothetical protein